MGLKHGKYIYVMRGDGYYVKVRVFKGREEGKDRYLVVGPKVKKPPRTAKVLREEQLPDEVRLNLYAL